MDLDEPARQSRQIDALLRRAAEVFVLLYFNLGSAFKFRDRNGHLAALFEVVEHQVAHVGHLLEVEHNVLGREVGAPPRLVAGCLLAEDTLVVVELLEDGLVGYFMCELYELLVLIEVRKCLHNLTTE